MSTGFCCVDTKSLFTNIKKENEDAVMTSYWLSEVITNSLGPFTKRIFIRNCMLKTADILPPEKKKLFEGISLTASAVAIRVDKLAANTYNCLLQENNSRSILLQLMKALVDQTQHFVLCV